MDQLIFASLSHTHYWYEVGMLKVPADMPIYFITVFAFRQGSGLLHEGGHTGHQSIFIIRRAVHKYIFPGVGIRKDEGTLENKWIDTATNNVKPRLTEAKYLLHRK